jgi:hypothetical protein
MMQSLLTLIVRESLGFSTSGTHTSVGGEAAPTLEDPKGSARPPPLEVDPHRRLKAGAERCWAPLCCLPPVERGGWHWVGRVGTELGLEGSKARLRALWNVHLPVRRGHLSSPR